MSEQPTTPEPRSRGDVLDALAATRRSVEELSDRIDGLASKEELETVKTEQGKKNRRIAAGIAVVVLLLFGVLGVVSELRDVAEGNRQTATVQARILEELIECTTPADPDGPPHECYERGQAGQAEAVAAIVTAILAGIDARIAAILESVGIPPPTTTTTIGTS